MNGQQQSTLQNIYSRSFPANNLFEVSLVKDTNPELPFYKNRYFAFLSLTPGAQNEQGQRTFNKDGKITLKAECEKLFALANSIRAYVRGQMQIGQFAIFTDSSKSNYGGGTVKTIFAGQFDQKQQNSEQTAKKIALSFKTGQNKPIGLFWSPAEAVAVASIIDFIADKGLELDFNERHNSVGNISQPQQQPPQQQSQQVVDNFSNSMMDNSAPPIDEDIPF